MDYRTRVAEIRSARDREIESIRVSMRVASTGIGALRAQAAEAIALEKAARDAEVRRLASQGLTLRAIGHTVGCSESIVVEVLRPEAHERYNARRRARWRQRHLRAVGE